MKALHHIAHLLIPRHTNNYKAKLLHSSSLFVITLFIISLQLSLNFVRTPNGSVLGYAAQISVEEVIKLTNQKRAEAGLAPLRHNPELSKGALSKGQHMMANDYWAHVAPDGTQPWKFFSDVSYKYRYAGENLARDFSNPTAAVNAWMASPTHKENLLSPKYKEIGIGVVEGDLSGTDTTIIVQFFGATLADTIPAEPLANANTPAVTTAPRIVASPLAIATPIPTLVPTATPVATPVITIAAVEGVTGEPQVLVSPFTTTRSLSAALVMVLMVAFVVDIIVVSRRRIVRISGRSMAHVAFLGMTLAIVMIIQAGQII